MVTLKWLFLGLPSQLQPRQCKPLAAALLHCRSRVDAQQTSGGSRHQQDNLNLFRGRSFDVLHLHGHQSSSLFSTVSLKLTLPELIFNVDFNDAVENKDAL